MLSRLRRRRSLSCEAESPLLLASRFPLTLLFTFFLLQPLPLPRLLPLLLLPRLLPPLLLPRLLPLLLLSFSSLARSLSFSSLAAPSPSPSPPPPTPSPTPSPSQSPSFFWLQHLVRLHTVSGFSEPPHGTRLDTRLPVKGLAILAVPPGHVIGPIRSFSRPTLRGWNRSDGLRLTLRNLP